MKRRSFVSLASIGIPALFFTPIHGYSGVSEKKPKNFKRVVLNVISSGDAELPSGKRTSFGWPSVGIAPGSSLVLKPEKKLSGEHFWFRLSGALEIWDIKLLKVKIANVGTELGTMDIRHSSVLVPYELKINAEFIPLINQYGIELTLDSPSSLWIFSERDRQIDNSAFLPHILIANEETGTTEAFLSCMESVNSIQSFGWREGTVLDGLWQLYKLKGHKKALDVINQHFSLYFRDGNLCYENGRSDPRLNVIDGIESTIPFATLVRLDKNLPILKTVVDGWEKLKKPDGRIIDGTLVSAEGCYTIAYPMAVIGKAWSDEKLMKEALNQLKQRFVLYNDNKIYLRYNTGNGNYTYPNWARGAAWNLLGFCRTIVELKDIMTDDDIVKKFREGIDLALSMQREDGLWGCFMHKLDSLPDTSGSAGIAAAILIGVRNNILPTVYALRAKKCWRGLQAYITPDGFLKGVAQDNRGGIELQESDYRVIAQMGMGMLSQLYAEL